MPLGTKKFISVYILSLGLCKKVFAAFGGRIFFCETHHFRDFAKRNRENDVSHKI